MRPIRVLQVGLGPVGQMLTPYLAERSGIELAGAVDIDPAKVGKDAGEISNLGRKLGIPVRPGFDGLAPGSADVAVVATTSWLADLLPTLEAAARLGMNVVSTCEELVYPWTRQKEPAERIDALARAAKISILGTGVNPGFLMDALAVTATGICRNVERIRIERIQDASQRRVPFQKKIGAGLSVEEFREKAASGRMGHVGLTESMQMIAARLGWALDRTEDLIEPVVAERETESGTGTVPPGRVIGLEQRGRGWCASEEPLELVFRAALGESESRDTIEVKGIPEFRMTIPGGIHGDIATCAIVVNAIPAVLEAPSGLRTMIDIPPISFRK